jgi:hypothetical protein
MVVGQIHLSILGIAMLVAAIRAFLCDDMLITSIFYLGNACHSHHSIFRLGYAITAIRAHIRAFFGWEMLATAIIAFLG